MRLKTILLGLAGAGLMASAPAQAVDLVGAYQDALDFDPVLQAAEFRREATQENRKIARANLLPQLGASGNWRWGTTETAVPGLELDDNDIETNNYSLDLRQSLYRQANYEALDVARGQISQAEALYQSAYLDFLFGVSERYFLVLTRIDGVTFAEAEEKALKRQFEQAEQRFEVGLTAVTDVHEARASYDNARARWSSPTRSTPRNGSRRPCRTTRTCWPPAPRSTWPAPTCAWPGPVIFRPSTWSPGTASSRTRSTSTAISSAASS